MKDEQFGKELAEIAEITDLDTFTLEIFKAKSDVSKLTDEQIVTNDYKIFDFGDKKVLIDQLETVEQNVILSNKKNGPLMVYVPLMDLDVPVRHLCRTFC